MMGFNFCEGIEFAKGFPNLGLGLRVLCQAISLCSEEVLFDILRQGECCLRLTRVEPKQRYRYDNRKHVHLHYQL